MAKGTLDCTPEVLSDITLLLPRSVQIAGSVEMDGAVRLSIIGNGLTEGQHYQMIIRDEPTKRIVELVEAA